jgi:hypothetical protein
MTNKKPFKQKRSRIALLLPIIVIILLAGSGLAYWTYHKKSAPASVAPVADNTIDYSPSKPSDNAANNARKGSASSNSTLDSGSSTGQSSTPLSVTVTRAGVVGNQLQVGTLVEGTTTGICTLSVSQTGQQTITKTETIQQQNNTYSCPVFSLPTSQFPNQGSWNVSVAVTSNGKTASGQWQANPVALGS